ncbi:O-antigen ligase family protein [Gemmatimonadota bacterium]
MRVDRILALLAVLIGALVIGYGIGGGSYVIPAMVAGLIFGLGTFIDLRIPLYGIVPAMVLLPELPLALPIRTEDLLMVPLASAWLARVAIGRAHVPRTPLNGPIFALLAVEFTATIWGALMGETDLAVQLYGGTFFFLKTVEVTLFFLLTISIIRDYKDLRRLVFLFVMAGGALGIWGIVQRGSVREGQAIYGPAGEMGYSLLGLTFVVLMAAGLGLLLTYKSMRGRQLLLLCVAPIMVALPFTLSRQSYVGAAAALFTLIWIRDRRLLIPAIAVAAMLPFIAPDVVQERAASIVTREANPLTGASPYATRIHSLLRRGPEVLRRSPLLGFGLASLPPGFLDNQYLLTVYYTGLIGLAIFLWVLVRAGRVAYGIYRGMPDSYRGLALGWLAATIGLALAGLAGNPFTAIRARQAYWFLAAVSLAAARLRVMRLKQLEELEGRLSRAEASEAEVEASEYPGVGEAWHDEEEGWREGEGPSSE